MLPPGLFCSNPVALFITSESHYHENPKHESQHRGYRIFAWLIIPLYLLMSAEHSFAAGIILRPDPFLAFIETIREGDTQGNLPWMVWRECVQ